MSDKDLKLLLLNRLKYELTTNPDMILVDECGCGEEYCEKCREFKQLQRDAVNAVNDLINLV